jgi:hypothetical protein
MAGKLRLPHAVSPPDGKQLAAARAPTLPTTGSSSLRPRALPATNKMEVLVDWRMLARGDSGSRGSTYESSANTASSFNNKRAAGAAGHRPVRSAARTGP